MSDEVMAKGDLALICGGFDGATSIFDDVKMLDLGECC